MPSSTVAYYQLLLLNHLDCSYLYDTFQKFLKCPSFWHLDPNWPTQDHSQRCECVITELSWPKPWLFLMVSCLTGQVKSHLYPGWQFKWMTLLLLGVLRTWLTLYTFSCEILCHDQLGFSVGTEKESWGFFFFIFPSGISDPPAINLILWWLHLVKGHLLLEFKTRPVMVFIVVKSYYKNTLNLIPCIFSTRTLVISCAFLPTNSTLKGPHHRCSIALSFMTRGNTVRSWGLLRDKHTQMTRFNHGTIEG